MLDYNVLLDYFKKVEKREDPKAIYNELNDNYEEWLSDLEVDIDILYDNKSNDGIDYKHYAEELFKIDSALDCAFCDFFYDYDVFVNYLKNKSVENGFIEILTEWNNLKK